ncbi:T9SS type A sorting domain-containing protein [Hymenobacter baengnokdamensis]|uniref:T9SS type A sorting domain-containing protein n=1 Tax=Hymenobacter baengnokdamensis TaxID=2615203 RepID=UPI00124923EF|nr:T9SS type A sorting domain-containing protein [Hymenobacter baengnokdamensis]
MRLLLTRVRPLLRQLALLLALPVVAQAQLVLTSGSAVTTDFNALGSSATAALPAGFVVSNVSSGITYSSGTNTSATTLAAGTSGTGALSSTSSGGTYNFANGVTATATDRALGFLSTGTYVAPRHLLLAIQNNTGQTITDLSIAYDIEKYRAGTRAYEWQFWTSTDGSTWVQQTSLTQSYTADGANAVVNPTTTVSKNTVLTGLNLAAGAITYLRWSYVGIGGSTNGQGLGLDNLVLTPSLSATAPTGTTSITTTSSNYSSPYCVSSSTGSAAFNVAYTASTTGTSTFTGTFKAQLSNAAGTFPADATSNIIGTGTGTSPISATIPAGTPSGTGYRIRVVNDGPSTLGSDNGSNLTITLAPASNPVSVAPATAQTLTPTGSGNTLTASAAVPSAYAWFYGITAGGPFSTAIASATTATYQPNGGDFPGMGTYYVVAQATTSCGSVVGTSSPVTITVGQAPSALTASVASLPDFGSVAIGSTSAVKSFSVSGNGLTGAVTITPAPGFEIRTGATAFACCAIVLSPASGTLGSTQIDVRFAPQLAQAYAGNIAVSSPGFSEQDVAVTGTGIAPTYPATVNTTAPSAIMTTSATAGGTTSDDGGSPITAYGVAYGTDTEPTVAGLHTTDGAGLATFTSSLTGLQPGVLYYVRAYATNAQGTLYGEQLSFTTVAVPLADEPTTSSTITASAVYPSRILLTFSGGNGAKHLLLAHLNGAVNQDPSDATTYTASATFGKGSVLGSDADNYVILAAASDTVTVFGLHPNTPYTFAVYEYNDNNTPYAENYLTSNPGTFALTTPALPPTRLFQEDFSYPAGTLLTADSWAAHSGAGTKPFTVTSNSLSYAGYSAGTGNSTAFTGSGEDDDRQFTTMYARTPVYASFLVSVSSASTTGDYFLHLGPTILSSTFRGRVFARKSATGTLEFGVAGSGTPVYAPTEYAFNTTYLLLLKYSFDETGNESDLFINPATTGISTAPDASVVETASTSPTDIGTIALRQGSSSPLLTLDGLTVATAFPLPTPLPVTLTQFTAQFVGHTVQLAWQTATESNLDHFVVERAPDGKTFTALQTVPATGNGNGPGHYSALDAQATAAGASQLYYRLRSVDRDGSRTYSPVETVTLTPASAGLALFPNPTKATTTLTGATAGTTIQVLDALGRVVSTTTADATGAATLALPAGLASGVYIVRTGSQALRLLVQ